MAIGKILTLSLAATSLVACATPNVAPHGFDFAAQSCGDLTTSLMTAETTLDDMRSGKLTYPSSVGSPTGGGQSSVSSMNVPSLPLGYKPGARAKYHNNIAHMKSIIADIDTEIERKACRSQI